MIRRWIHRTGPARILLLLVGKVRSRVGRDEVSLLTFLCRHAASRMLIGS